MAAERWRDNPGRQPTETIGKDKRVAIILAKDREAMREPEYNDERDPTGKHGWAADSARWSLTGSPFDIALYRLL